jgi:predicted transcriptional regulator
MRIQPKIIDINTKDGKKVRKHSEHPKTIAKGMYLRDIFINRTNVFNGLTRYEVIAEHTNTPLKDVLKYDEKKIEELWLEIRAIKKYLREKKVIAIIHKYMPRGFELKDVKYGKRILEQGQNIHYSCSKIDDALSYRSILDKSAKGLTEAGDEVEEIAESYDKHKEIVEAIATPSSSKAKNKPQESYIYE